MRGSRLLWLSLGLAVFLAGCKSDPKSIKDQVAILKSKSASTNEKLRAVENLRKLNSRDTVPGLIEGLKSSPARVKADIAVALGEQGDVSAVMPLANAIELAPTSEKAAKEADAANEKISRALGDLGGKGATPALLKLLAATTSSYVKFEVLNALGKLGDPSATPVLSELALNEKVEAPINKKAMGALAMIGSPEALPLFVKGLFFERGSLSLYPDASFGLFRLRAGAYDAVLALASGKDKDTLEWAKARSIWPAALLGKAAQVEGDLRDPRAVPLLIKQLKYKDDDPSKALFVQVAAAESLGRMRAKAAIPALCELLKGEDREGVALSLSRMGDKSVLPKFEACATSGIWNSREPCMQGVVALGGKGEAKLFDGYLKDEPKRYMTECKHGDYGEVDCDKEKEQVLKDRSAKIAKYKAVLEEVGKCEDVKCLGDELGSADPVVREKAAYAAVQKGDLEILPALLESVKRTAKEPGDLVARTAAVLASDWLVASNAEARAKLKGEIKGLQALIEQDSKVGLTAESTEEVKRLVDVIDHGREAGPAPSAAAAPAADDTEEKKPAKPAKKKAAKKGK